MRLKNISSVAILSTLLAGCCQGSPSDGLNATDSEVSRLQVEIQDLQQQISSLEESNAAQESRIKDLEDDLESVITFLNNELNY